MAFKKVSSQLNIPAQCKKYQLRLWQCPHFLFLVMGLIIIASIIAVYTVATRYITDPSLVSLAILFLTAILFIIAVIITQSFERIAEASRMKTEFISIVSHQLRSPISNLKWALEFLMSGRLGKIEEKQVDYFRILKENSARMTELVNDLLTVSRLETGRLPLKKKETSLEELVKKLIAEFEPLCRASKIEIKLEVQPNLPKALIDSSQIRLVIENFLDNAIRYSRDMGKVEVNIEKRGRNIYLAVKDSGVGIPKEDQKFIFQKFFRAANILGHWTKGSGLGLYIAKYVVKNSGGKIGFQSKENKGSTFWFTISIK